MVMGCSTFYRNVKAHKTRQKLETVINVKARKAPKKMKARKEERRENMQTRKVREHIRYVGMKGT